jgi:hypothetical protein
MKKINLLLLAAMTAFTITSCEDDTTDTVVNSCPDGENGTDDCPFVKSGEISSDEVWETGNIYVLDGRVTVTNQATLTIQPGVVVKAKPGGGASSSALLISREGNIEALGTASSPIIFTSTADEIEPGQINSPNLDPLSNGFWGGVIILGKAPISASQTSVQIEGIPTSDQNGLYGGGEPAHSSGTFQYVSIRHGGTNIGAGNEINGLTLGGVGSGTVIDHVEIVGNQDDGIEWFGGSVNMSHALVWNTGDDGLDTDQDWTGTLDGFIVVNAGDRAMELDGPEGSNSTGDNFEIKNGTVYMGGASQSIDFDDNTNAAISGVYFYGYDEDETQATSGYSGFLGTGLGSVSNFEVTLVGGLTVADLFDGVDAALVATVGENANTVGVSSASAEYSWTWASTSGALGSIGL